MVIILVLLFSTVCFGGLVNESVMVDGKQNNTEVVIFNRKPIFSFQVTEGTIVSSFTIIVSSDNLFLPVDELWNYTGSTTTQNTSNLITKVEYSGSDLSTNSTYYFQVTIYQTDSSSSSATSWFYTVLSSVTYLGERFDLQVDYNNPFNPLAGQKTKFRYVVKDRDRKIRLSIFSFSGEFITSWPEQDAIKDVLYTTDWDGRDKDGNLLPSGRYLVNLDAGRGEGITRIVVIIK